MYSLFISINIFFWASFMTRSFHLNQVRKSTQIIMKLDENKFVSDAMKKRISSGNLNVFDLNKLYPLTRRNEEDLSSGISHRLRGKDELGIIIGLESCIIDASPVRNKISKR